MMNSLSPRLWIQVVEEPYQLYARNCDGEINDIGYEELVRFNKFLTNYLKKEEGSDYEQS